MIFIGARKQTWISSAITDMYGYIRNEQIIRGWFLYLWRKLVESSEMWISWYHECMRMYGCAVVHTNYSYGNTWAAWFRVKPVSNSVLLSLSLSPYPRLPGGRPSFGKVELQRDEERKVFSPVVEFLPGSVSSCQDSSPPSILREVRFGFPHK